MSTLIGGVTDPGTVGNGTSGGSYSGGTGSDSNTIQEPTAVGGMVVPEYIGYPGAQSAIDGSDRFRKDMEKRFHIAILRPLLPQIKDDANIYTGDKGKGWSKFVSALQANNVDTSQLRDQQLKIVLSTMIPLTENFTNEYGDSELLSGMSGMMGGMGSELAFVSGTDKIIGQEGDKESNTTSLTGEMKQAGGLLGEFAEGAENKAKDLSNMVNSMANSNSKAGQRIGKIAQQMGKAANAPWSKIGWPQMWKNCTYSCSYELSIRLYAYNSFIAEEYKNTILGSIAALQQFCCPQSEDGILYEWPFLCELLIPGTVHIPLGYCSNMSIIKGGDVNHLALSGRPSIVDIRMTINNVYSILVNIVKKGVNAGDRPNIGSELAALYSGRNLGALASGALEGTPTADRAAAAAAQLSAKRVQSPNQKEAKEAFNNVMEFN